VLFHHMLHHKIIAVGIDPQMGNAFQTPFKTRPEYAAAAIGSNAMDGAVGLLLKPISLRDHPVGGILPNKKVENAVDHLVTGDHLQPLPEDILPQQGFCLIQTPVCPFCSTSAFAETLRPVRLMEKLARPVR